MLISNHLYSSRPHPYIFFNQDRETITFVGFTVNRHGDLIDLTQKTTIEAAIMTPDLHKGLIRNNVNVDDDHQRWTRDTKMEKITMVMGVSLSKDPDPSYVLTVDNVIKILAIQMRFR